MNDTWKSRWPRKKIIVTGGAGFLGGYVVRELLHKGAKKQNILIPRKKDFDLREKENCSKVTRGADIVIHLAGIVGGIGYNQKFPGTLFYDNVLMGVNLIEESLKNNVEKFVAIGTICSYPKFTPVPFHEDDLWNGYPEETNAPYGLAKKMLIVQSQAYRQQYGFNSISLLPVNLYGPLDNFDDGSSHVIPALIKRFLEAREESQKEVVVWGTGKATREFLYVEDAAQGIILATERYNKPEPVNLGSSFEIAISELASLIAEIVGFKGKIVFDANKPDGQPKRKLDTTRAQMEFGFRATTTFKEGLRQTIKWYEKERATKKVKKS